MIPLNDALSLRSAQPVERGGIGRHGREGVPAVRHDNGVGDGSPGIQSGQATGRFQLRAEAGGRPRKQNGIAKARDVEARRSSVYGTERQVVEVNVVAY